MKYEVAGFLTAILALLWAVAFSIAGVEWLAETLAWAALVIFTAASTAAIIDVIRS